jgi:hypothetical protein
VLSAVDVQQLFLQSTAVEKVQQMQQQHPDMQQKYLAMQLTEERKLLQAKIANAEETERVLLREKEERRRKKMVLVQHSPEDGSKREDQETPSPEEQGEYIDIRV